jgi:hypothetical protein
VVEFIVCTITSFSHWNTIQGIRVHLQRKHLKNESRVKVKLSHPLFFLERALDFNLLYSCQVTPEDLLPVTLCTSCIYKLEMCHEFVHGCLDADAKLRTFLGLKVDEEVSKHSKIHSCFDLHNKWHNPTLGSCLSQFSPVHIITVLGNGETCTKELHNLYVLVFMLLE